MCIGSRDDVGRPRSRSGSGWPAWPWEIGYSPGTFSGPARDLLIETDPGTASTKAIPKKVLTASRVATMERILNHHMLNPNHKVAYSDEFTTKPLALGDGVKDG